jgi:hypothetical protein
MTLSTNILLHEPHPTELVWDFVTRELLKRPDYASEDQPHKTSDWEHKIRRGIGMERWGAPGQGAPAWAIAKWNPDGPIMIATKFDEMNEDEDGDQIPTQWSDGSILLNFDTAYGYQVGGAGCSDLHAAFILLLFKEFGALTWQNEFTGEWFELTEGDSVEQMKNLSQLGDPVVGAGALKSEAVV